MFFSAFLRYNWNIVESGFKHHHFNLKCIWYVQQVDVIEGVCLYISSF